MPVSTATNAGTTGVHWLLDLPDPRGSTAFVIDYKTGEVVERTAHQAYGAIDADYRPDRWKNFREDAKFTGQWDNAKVGLTYMGARYYSPQLARFISPDPLVVHALKGINPYEYGVGRRCALPTRRGRPEDQAWSQMSVEQPAAQLAVLEATDPFNMGDFNPSDPGARPETASDAAGGSASDFDPGGSLSDFNGLPGPSVGDLASAAGQEIEGFAAGAWNTAVDVGIDTTLALNPALSQLGGFIP